MDDIISNNRYAINIESLKYSIFAILTPIQTRPALFSILKRNIFYELKFETHLIHKPTSLLHSKRFPQKHFHKPSCGRNQRALN